MSLRRWFQADEIATDDFGWTANLAIFRVVFLAAVALPFACDVLRWTELVMPSIPAEVWVPVAFYRHIPFNFLVNAALAHAIALADVALIVMALAGLFTRTSLTLATILSLYLFGLPENLGKVSHFQHTVWFMALLAAGPSGAMLSVDAIISAVRRADRGAVALEVPPRSALRTLRYAWALIGLLYLGSGLAKLNAAYLYRWVSADNLRHIFWRNWFERRIYRPGFTPPVRIDRLPAAMIDAWGAGAVALETGFVAFVLFRWARWFLILAGLAFHAGNGLILGIWFHTLIGSYVCLVDWSSLGRQLTARLTGQREPLLVLYDGSCTMCRRTIAILKTLDISGAILPVSGFSSDPPRLAHPEITEEMVLHDLYVVGDGYVAGGYDAYRKMAASMPLLWLLAPLMRLPPIAAVGRRIYRRVADSRYCTIGEAPRSIPPIPATASSTAVSNRVPVSGSWRALNLMGIFLIVGQASLSLLDFASQEIRTTELPIAMRPVAQVGSEIVSHLPGRAILFPWPFDLYPTFTGAAATESFYRHWNVVLVSADGSESPVPPEAFARAFGYWATTANLMGDTSRNPFSDGRRAAVVRILWTKLPPPVRTATVTVRAYDSIDNDDPDDAQLVHRTLIAEFPAGQLSPDPRTTSSSNRNPSSNCDPSSTRNLSVTHNPSSIRDPSSNYDYAPQKPIEVRP